MFFAAALLATALTAQPLTIEDYATMPTISAPQFSPDGRRIVYTVMRADMTRSAYDSNLWMVDADGTNDVQLTQATGSDTHARWSPDGRSIAFLSDREAGRNAIWILNPAGGEPYRLTSEPAPIRDFVWSPDSRSIAFLMPDPISPEEEKRVREKEDEHFVGRHRQQHLYIIDVESRSKRRMTCCEFSVEGMAWSPDGKRLAVVRVPTSSIDDQFHSDIFTVDATKSCDDRSCPSMIPLVVRPGIDQSPQFSPDGKSVAFISSGGVFDWLTENQIWVVDLATRKARLVSGEYNRTPENFVWSGDSKSIWFDGPLNTTAQLFRVNADGSGFRDLSNAPAVIVDADVATKSGRAAFVMQSLTKPPELYVADLAAKTFAPRQLTHHNDGFEARELAETRLIRWKNPKDGLEIEGLLTLPIGYKTGTRVPLLTFVHGGPASHFDQGFLGYLGYLYAPQVLAQRGFAVLRPNPRGTGGYGQQFREANRNDWGGMDWVDINAGIDKVIADGIADSSHMGLMGWSYGGFMAAWAIGHSDRLQAISVGAPVVDLLSFHGTTDIREFIPSYFPATPAVSTGAQSAAAAPAEATDTSALEAMKNVPLVFSVLLAHSPIWQLKPTRAHVLIQHGEADERVPPSQGLMLYRTLREMGTDVSMVTYPRSHHVPNEPKQRIDVMRRNVEFFRKCVK